MRNTQSGNCSLDRGISSVDIQSAARALKLSEVQSPITLPPGPESCVSAVHRLYAGTTDLSGARSTKTQEEMSMRREIIRVEPLSTYLERWKAPTSAVTRHGDTVYVSGFPPFDPATTKS